MAIPEAARALGPCIAAMTPGDRVQAGDSILILCERIGPLICYAARGSSEDSLDCWISLERAREMYGYNAWPRKLAAAALKGRTVPETIPSHQNA